MLRRFALLGSASAVLLACSVTSTSDPGSSSGFPEPPPSGTTTGAPTTTPPTSTPDAGDAAVPVVPPAPLPPFELTSDGKARVLATIKAEETNIGGVVSCKKTMHVTAVLVPEGTERVDPAPNLDVNVCVSLLPANNDVAYGDEADGLARVQFHFQFPGSSHFPVAEGPGLHVVQDGTKGVFEASGSGTFEVATGVKKPFTLKLRQTITK